MVFSRLCTPVITMLLMWWTLIVLQIEFVKSDLNDLRRPKVDITPRLYKTKYRTGYLPRLYNHTKPFLMCITPKSGTTRWTELLVYLQTGRHHYGGAAHNFIPSIHHATKMSSIDLNVINSLDRITIVRNPFPRFISSFFDHKGRFPDFNMTMDELIDHLLGGGKVPLFNHIEPQTKNCGNEFFDYDFVLRIEEMSLWYDDFADQYDLKEIFASNWPGAKDPFYKPMVSTTSPLSKNINAIIGTEPWVGEHDLGRRNYRHESEFSFLRYYLGNPVLVAKVFQYFERDFKTFGYPAWDGNLVNFRFV